MNKKRSLVALLILLSMVLVTSGCALFKLALNAGIAYGIYEATK